MFVFFWSRENFAEGKRPCTVNAFKDGDKREMQPGQKNSWGPVYWTDLSSGLDGTGGNRIVNHRQSLILVSYRPLNVTGIGRDQHPAGAGFRPAFERRSARPAAPRVQPIRSSYNDGRSGKMRSFSRYFHIWKSLLPLLHFQLSC